jgi:hypothetical protein
LNGKYLFADRVTATIWTLPLGSLQFGTTLTAADFEVRTGDFIPPPPFQPTRFSRINGIVQTVEGTIFVWVEQAVVVVTTP